MKKDNLIFLKHIEQSIADIFDYTKGVSKADFLKDKKLGDAVTRKVEILGEAVKNLPADFRNKHQEIPWGEIARTRDKLIHQYFGVDFDKLWAIVEKDLPALKKNIKKLILDLEKSRKEEK